MSPTQDFTVDQLTQIVANAIAAHDVEAVDIAIRLMAVLDPNRAQEVLDTIEFGLALASGVGSSPDPKNEE